MAASILSMNLSGRFRVGGGGEARCLGQAVLQRLLRGTDLLFGQQAQFNPCLPGNYRMVGTPSAFIVYNCQLYSATELHHCPVHDTWKDVPPSNWIVSRVFFEQVGQEVLAVSWFTDDSAVQSKRKREGIVRRLLHLSRDLSSSFGLPVLIGGSFQLSMEEVTLLIRDAGLDDSFRCYGYWLDSMRRSVRASSLFIASGPPKIELNRVRPRSLAGNVCLGFKNDTWRNPEDSFYYDPLSAKVTVTVTSVPSFVLEGRKTLLTTTDASPASESDEDTPRRRRGTRGGTRGGGSRPRTNFDVIRTTMDSSSSSSSHKPKTVARKTISSFDEDEVDGGGFFLLQDLRGQTSRSVQSATKRSSSSLKSTTSVGESDEMKELREILTRLKVGREVQIGVAADTSRGGYRLRESFPYAERGNHGGDGVASYHQGMEVVVEDLEEPSSGQFSRKLSTISESGESSCSSVMQDFGGSLEKEEPDKDDSIQQELEYALDRSGHGNLWRDGKRIVGTVSSVEEFTDGSLERTDGGSSSSTRCLPSKQSSQDERIVEGSSDVDQDDKAILRFSMWNESCMEQKSSLFKVTEEERVHERFVCKEHDSSETAAVQHGYLSSSFSSSANSSPISEILEEDRLESNLACRLM